MKNYPDKFYANLLSLKIAKKRYTNTPSFLGGAELLNMTTEVPFERIRQYLFSGGTATVFGSLDSHLYLYSGDLLSEYSSYIDISKTKPIKAFYGLPKSSDRIIVSFVLRSANSEGIVEKISEILKDNNFEVIQILLESVSKNDAWGSVSVATNLKNEKKLVEIYEKNLKLLTETLSIGVYRVSKEN